jgi:CRISPR-associated endonuclease/helicase Cas3
MQKNCCGGTKAIRKFSIIQTGITGLAAQKGANLKPAFAAHTPRNASDPNSPWHNLTEHLEQVAADAAKFATKFGAAEIAHWAGLLHDAGKFSDAFQSYLWQAHVAKRDGIKEPERGKIDHSSTGAVIAKTFARADENATGLELPWVIAAHHAGLKARDKLEEDLKKKADDAVLINGAGKALEWPPLAPLLEPDFAFPQPEFASKLEREFFVRMLLSCLVDADHLDTEAFGSPHKTQIRGEDKAPFEALFEKLRAAQLEKMANAENTEVNRVRAEVYHRALEQAPEKPGFFRLSVPTGGGKTRSSLAFGLQHALKHDLERIIYVVPYLTITRQIAKEFAEILGSENVLEHHSGVQYDPNEGETWAKLAAENWDAKIIVTTSVQFLEGLFARKPSKLRKLHRVSKAVVIFDEAQTLPAPLLTPIMDALHELVNRYGSSIVFCTATQPALDAGSGFPDLNDREIAPDPARLFRSLERVEYRFSWEPWDWDRIAQELKAHPQVLCVVNTRAHARAIWQALNDKDAIHLSTHLCGAHRQAQIERIERRLELGEPCRVVSTQLIEAGVNLDFPVVFRAFAPLDSIVQAAGRCNRNMKLHPAKGLVVMFKPEQPGLPKGIYEAATFKTERWLRNGVDLNASETFHKYFTELHNATDTDAQNVQALRERFDYPEVKKAFKIIDDDTTPVLVRQYDSDAVNAILEQPFNRQTMRALQSYLVNIFNNQLPKLDRFVRPCAEHPELLEWVGKYDEHLGILEEVDFAFDIW